MQLHRSSRLSAVVTALVLSGTALWSAAPAQARTSSKTYKAGAVALGVLGTYLIVKGKTVEGAAVLGGGALAYEKGKKVARDERYGRTDYPRYGTNNPDYGYGSNGNVYPDSDYRVNDRNQSGDWNSGWRGSAQLQPRQGNGRGNKGHHYGQRKHHQRDDQEREGCDDND